MIFFNTAFKLIASADRTRTKRPWHSSRRSSASCSKRRSWEAMLGPLMMKAAGSLVLKQCQRMFDILTSSAGEHTLPVGHLARTTPLHQVLFGSPLSKHAGSALSVILLFVTAKTTSKGTIPGSGG